MIYTLGIDIGSTTTKCVILGDGNKYIADSLVIGGAGTKAPDEAFKLALKEASLEKESLSAVLATGYGRFNFSETSLQMSELSCHARGAYHVFPETRTIIDIGGQDAKVINLSPQGKIANFVMNDKCAAGTGRFLDVMAGVLQLKIDDFEMEADKADKSIRISNTCTVFAESEVISQLAKGENISNIVKGICESVATRVSYLAKRTNIEESICISGGVARNGAVRKALENELGKKIKYSHKSQFMGALGAASYAFEKFESSKEVL